MGGIWGVNGEYSFLAEEYGATKVTCLDVFGPTPEFEQKKKQRNSSVEFVVADVTDREKVKALGQFDLVFCAGVLYHHPNPYEIIAALRSLCSKTLILRSSTIPERPGYKNMAVYWPMLNARERSRWNLARLGLPNQVGISGPFDPSQGYGNWFWGLTPSCMESLCQTAGFEVTERRVEAFAHTIVCKAIAPALKTETPSEEEANLLGAEISRQGIARPA